MLLFVSTYRYVKSDRAVILINLCIALIISYAIFIVGVDRTENEVRLFFINFSCFGSVHAKERNQNQPSVVCVS